MGERAQAFLRRLVARPQGDEARQELERVRWLTGRTSGKTNEAPGKQRERPQRKARSTKMTPMAIPQIATRKARRIFHLGMYQMRRAVVTVIDATNA
jgi:hypothetical protein